MVRDPATDLLEVNGEFSVSLVLARCHARPRPGIIAGKCVSTPACARTSRWRFAWTTTTRPPLDYYLLPRLDFGQARICLADNNAFEFDSYRFDTLDYLYGMAERFRIRRAA